MLEVVDLDMNRRVSGNARADIEITAMVILIDDQKHITVSLREPNALEDGVPHNLFLHFEYRPDQVISVHICIFRYVIMLVCMGIWRI